MASKWMEKHAIYSNKLQQIVTYINNQLPQDIQSVDSLLTRPRTAKTLEDLDAISRRINQRYSELSALRKEITDVLTDAETAGNTQAALREIGELQQTVSSYKDTLKKAKEELVVAEARLASIATRKTSSSYEQVFGYIFRPFRKASYLVLIPLIFLMIITILWLLRPDLRQLIPGSAAAAAAALAWPEPSAPPANNINKLLGLTAK